MFCVSPELIVARLFCPEMKGDEAIMIAGAERFSDAHGYARQLRFSGPHHDARGLLPAGALASFVVAIDALDLRSGEVESQYAPDFILRELSKAWVGFSIKDGPNEIATGNGGCGAFGGDPELKSIIQWLAISRVDRLMHYFPWDIAVVHRQFPTLANQLVEDGITIGQLVNFLLRELRPGSVYDQINRHFFSASV